MKQIPFLDLQAQHTEIQTELNAAYTRVIDSSYFIMGTELETFETEFAQYNGIRHCIGVGNGLEALHLALKACDIGPGDEVVVPSNTFIATWLAVSECGAIPVPVEPCADTYNLDADKIEAAISNKTKAIIPVHLYGQPADMDAINEIAQKYDLIVIEDAAQSQGAEYKNKKAGGLSHVAATSFYPGKNLGALGDGGAILTDNDEIAAKIRKLRNYGSVTKYCHELKGYNSRLDELQAAFLRAKLKKLDQWNEQRRNIARFYQQQLANIDLKLPAVPDWAKPVWHLYVIQTKQRDVLQQYLADKNIATVIHYPLPPHLQECYQQTYAKLSLPIAEQMAREVLSIPIYPHMTLDETQYVADTIKSFFA